MVIFCTKVQFEIDVMGLFYRIWVDFIVRLRSRETNKNNWKSKSMIFMTISMTFNFVLLMSILQKYILRSYFYELDISIFSNYENNIITVLVLFVLPCVGINYLLIFKGDRYEKLTEKYPHYNGKLFATYFSISLLLPVVLMWISIFIQQ